MQFGIKNPVNFPTKASLLSGVSAAPEAACACSVCGERVRERSCLTSARAPISTWQQNMRARMAEACAKVLNRRYPLLDFKLSHWFRVMYQQETQKKNI